jgi:hypothetical protein
LCACARARFDGTGDAIAVVAVVVAELKELDGVLLDSMALPMKPPISPERTAMKSAPMKR